jgi:hypothetical protein
MSYSHEKIYLLTIRGTLAPTSLEAARQVHNQTAGAPDGVAAARSLGDLSHMVYVPVNKELPELFIMDLCKRQEQSEPRAIGKTEPPPC